MVDTVKPGEIIFCNMHLKLKDGSVRVVERIIWSREWNEPFQTEFLMSNDDDSIFLNNHKIKKDAKLIKLDIISRHGFKNYRPK